MAMNRRSHTQNSRTRKNRQQSLEYQKFEERKLLAADCVAAVDIVDTSLLDQLSAREDVAWLQSGLNNLVEVASESDSNGTTTVFQQSWNGLPVFNSFVTVVQDSNGEITNVRDQARQNISGYSLDQDPISSDAATKIAYSSFDDVLESEANLAWYFAGNKARLAWLVETSVLDDSGDVSEYETWVNVFNGDVFDRDVTASAVAELLEDPITETGIFPRIVINDAVGPAGSREFVSGPDFDSVVSISVGCTGTLISSDTVLTARHCGIGAGNTVSFGDNSGAPDATFTVAAAFLPGGGNADSQLLNGGDVAILTLAGNVPASVATPTRLIDATTELVGLPAVTVGYGFNGVGSTGHQFSADGRRWGGENIIDVFGSPASQNGTNIFSTDFDDGTAGNNTIGGSSSAPLEFEATTAPGDSGGPLLVDIGGEWVIAGVLSGGTTNNSVYGDISWWTGTSIYRSAIEDAGGSFIGDEAGTISFDQSSYFVGDSIGIEVRDGNAVGDISVTVTSNSGDSETLTVSPNSSNGTYSISINSAETAPNSDDGTLQLSEGDQITVTYADADDGTGSSAVVTDTAEINVPGEPAVIGLDFDTANLAPFNWLSNLGQTGTFNDLGNEDGANTQVDLTINGGTANSFAVNLDPTTVPQHSNSLVNVDGQIFTGGDPIEFVYSDLDPLASYEVYVLSAEGFFDSIEQTVTIQGDGSAVSFEQRFDLEDLFINDQVGDSTRDFSDYAQVITADANGVITINVDPIAGTSDVVVAGLAIFPVAEDVVAAPEIQVNNTEPDRSILNETVIAFDDIVTIEPGAFELVQRGPDGGTVDVTSSIDNSSGQSVVTLSFGGQFVESSGSLTDGNYQLTVFGDQITSSSGTAIDGDGDGVAGGNLVYGDTAADNFFRFYGDANGDRQVDVRDLLPFRNGFNSSIGDSNFDEQFDSNGDGQLNVRDLLAFRENFGSQLAFV